MIIKEINTLKHEISSSHTLVKPKDFQPGLYRFLSLPISTYISAETLRISCHCIFFDSLEK